MALVHYTHLYTLYFSTYKYIRTYKCIDITFELVVLHKTRDDL